MFVGEKLCGHHCSQYRVPSQVFSCKHFKIPIPRIAAMLDQPNNLEKLVHFLVIFISYSLLITCSIIPSGLQRCQAAVDGVFA